VSHSAMVVPVARRLEVSAVVMTIHLPSPVFRKIESESWVETTLDGTSNHERDMMGFRRDRSELRAIREISRER
jgi:hypothetical protein